MKAHFFHTYRLLVLLLVISTNALAKTPHPAGKPLPHTPASDDHKTLPTGAAAPDFHLPGVDGKSYSLASFKDAKVLVIIFMCNHCPTSQAYEGRVIRLTRDYAAKGVSVVAINPNDPASLRLDELGYSDLGDSY